VEAMAERCFEITKDILVNALKQKDHLANLILGIKNFLSVFAVSKKSQLYLFDLYYGKVDDGLKEMELGYKLQWSIVCKAFESRNVFSEEQKQQIMKDQAEKDQSDILTYKKIQCKAASL